MLVRRTHIRLEVEHYTAKVEIATGAPLPTEERADESSEAAIRARHAEHKPGANECTLPPRLAAASSSVPAANPPSAPDLDPSGSRKPL